MSLYCGIDLHSNNHVLVLIDTNDKRLIERRLDNDLSLTLAALEPYRKRIAAIAVESTPNWYWLVDGLEDHGYTVKLVNTAAVKQYEGLKYSDDVHDAFWLAHLLRLGILPTGYIYPRPQRAVRDLLRHRQDLVQQRTALILKLHGMHWRHFGVQLKRNEIMGKRCLVHFDDTHVQAAWDTGLRLAKTIDREIKAMERDLVGLLEDSVDYQNLFAIPGIGAITTMTIVLETGEIRRFPKVGNYASYCRCVKSERLSNGKLKGRGNAKCGNKYLSWAYSEAAHFMVRYCPEAKRYYERKKRQTNALVAIRATAHKIARAFYHVLRDQVAFDVQKAFA